jgi:GT2 family glycosyltransferase
VSTSVLSIIIPTHDTVALTIKCLRAIERAECPARLEVIVVDDGSSDGTDRVVTRDFPGVRLIRREVAAGFSSAANAGLQAASGEIRLLLNSDTEVDLHSLAGVLKAFDGDPRLGIAGAQLRYPTGEPQWSGGAVPDLAWLLTQASGAYVMLSRIPFYRRARPLAVPGIRDVQWVPAAAMAIRSDTWAAVGPMDERFQLYAQDLDFSVRAREAGWRIAIVPGFSVMHHHGATVSTGPGAAGRYNPALMWRDLLFWARKHRGEAYANRARLAILAGARSRVAARRLSALVRGETSEEAARTNALRAAVASLYAEDSPATPD